MAEHLEILRNWCDIHKPGYAVILGSGQVFPSAGTKAGIIEIPYSTLPGFRKTGIKGHKGVLKLVTLEDKSALVFNGRFHLYEGCTFDEIIRPVELVRDMNIENLILTNSAGALNPEANVGDIVIIEDFLIPFDLGIPGSYGFEEEVRDVADGDIIMKFKQAGRKARVPLKMGVYVFMPGPAYETPSESRLLRDLGADVVGMSTAPEWWAAVRMGLKVAGLSLVTNVHRPDAPPPSHEEVLEEAEKGGVNLINVLHRTIFGNGA